LFCFYLLSLSLSPSLFLAIKESDLFQDLKALGFEPTHDHVQFPRPVGDLGKGGWEVIVQKKFVAQKWLEMKKVDERKRGQLVQVTHYAWGERAKKETSHVKVLEFISMVTGSFLDIRVWLLLPLTSLSLSC
jgi:hypothetical protein